jgi:hypothetical protein
MPSRDEEWQDLLHTDKQNYKHSNCTFGFWGDSIVQNRCDIISLASTQICALSKKYLHDLFLFTVWVNNQREMILQYKPVKKNSEQSLKYLM